MKIMTKLVTATALAALIAAPAFAQSGIVGIEDLDDRIEDIETDVADDLDEGSDDDRFGPTQFDQGWSGSLGLGLSATSGNTDTADLSLAGRLRYGNGPWNHSFGFAVQAAEDNNQRNKEEAFVTYDVNRYFTDRAYVFGLGSVRYDGFASNKWDAFLGAGPGYRVINRPNTTWRVQAGPGVRYIEDQLGNDTTEVAGILSSRAYRKLSDTAFFSGDTDILFSDDSTLIVSDLGITFKLSDTFSTRTSLRNEWNSDPLPGREHRDTSFNVSLIAGF